MEFNNYVNEGYNYSLIYSLFFKKEQFFGDEIHLKYEFNKWNIENEPNQIRLIKLLMVDSRNKRRQFSQFNGLKAGIKMEGNVCKAPLFPK